MLKSHFRKDGQTNVMEAAKNASLVFCHLEVKFPNALICRSTEALFTIAGLTDGGGEAIAGLPVCKDGFRCSSCGYLVLCKRTMVQHVSKHVRSSMHLARNVKLTSDQRRSAFADMVETSILCQRPFGSVKLDADGTLRGRSFHHSLYKIDPALYSSLVQNIRFFKFLSLFF